MADTLALHTHRGTPAVQRMVEFAPSSGGLALWAHHQDLPDAARAGEPLYTDGHTIFYTAAFERLTLAVQTGWVAHEVLHVALRHPQRMLELQGLLGDVDRTLFNLCADAIVNSTLAHLSWLELAPGCVRLEQLLAAALGVHQGAEAALLEWNVERLYRAIDDRQAPRGGSNRATRTSGAGEGGSGQRARSASARPSASTDAADQAPASAPRPDGARAAAARALAAQPASDLAADPRVRGQPQDQAEQTRQWSERILRGHAADGAHSMLRALIQDVSFTRVPWEQVLRVRLARALSHRPDVSWSRPTRSYLANQGRSAGGARMPWEPGTAQSRSVPRLAVLVDVSGSIDAALLARFAREIEAIARRLESSVVVVIGDDRVRRVERFEPGRARGAGLGLDGWVVEGGGGTDFTPLLEHADRYRPDIAVFLTDLQGPADFRPRWPVIWAVPQAQAHCVPPFGRTLVLS
jgi:hypothetical protein